jgi:hypothetical protein
VRPLLAPACLAALLASSAAACAGRAPAPEDLAQSAPIDARRELYAPVDLAVVASGDGPARGEVPDRVTFGRAALGTAIVLLRFSPTFQAGANVTGAFLLLAPPASARPATRAVSLETARVLEPWSSGETTWGRQPRLSVPAASAVVAPGLPRPIRLDVTPLVRAWAAGASDDHGLAVIASGDDPEGLALSMGTVEGVGPRLEVYVR